jgi:hypothetical protein
VQNKGTSNGMDCPQLLNVDPALNNAPALDMAFPQTELGGSTPTDKAMQIVANNLIPTRMSVGPDQAAQAKLYVILATDGAPNDICVGGAGGDGSAQHAGVVAAVDQMAAVGITTWVISLAQDPTLQMNLDIIAQHGDPTNPMAHTFNPTNPDELVMTLATLLGGAVGCNVVLNGTVKVGQECTGSVELNGTPLPCCQQDAASGAYTCAGQPAPTPDGWHLVDPSTIELLGNSCTNFLVGAQEMLHASFPCNVFTPS